MDIKRMSHLPVLVCGRSRSHGVLLEESASYRRHHEQKFQISALTYRAHYHQWHSHTLSNWCYPAALCCIQKKKKTNLSTQKLTVYSTPWFWWPSCTIQASSWALDSCSYFAYVICRWFLYRKMVILPFHAKMVILYQFTSVRFIRQRWKCAYDAHGSLSLHPGSELDKKMEDLMQHLAASQFPICFRKPSQSNVLQNGYGEMSPQGTRGNRFAFFIVTFNLKNSGVNSISRASQLVQIPTFLVRRWQTTCQRSIWGRYFVNQIVDKHECSYCGCTPVESHEDEVLSN